MSHCCPKTWIKFFKAVCDEQRHAILDCVRKNEKIKVGDIVKKMKISQPTVSHHLKILCDAEIVVSEKKGKEVFYSLHEKSIIKCCSGFMERFHPKTKKE